MPYEDDQPRGDDGRWTSGGGGGSGGATGGAASEVWVLPQYRCRVKAMYPGRVKKTTFTATWRVASD